MKTQLFIFSLILLLFSAGSCDTNNDANNKIELSFKAQKIVAADNAFGLDVFQRISADEEKANFMISPLSISMALSMAYNGAETATRDEMAEALQIEDFSREELNETYRDLIEALLHADKKVAMEIANSIWYRNTYQVEQDFLTVNSTFYDAEVKEADFNSPETLDLINKWVSDKTHGKIPSILNEIPAEAVLYLINAIYFNGTWSKEFNPESTQELTFNVSEQEQVSAAMMGRIDTIDYQKNELFSAIRMPYGDGNFSMTVMLPNEGKSIADLTSSMNAENWKQWQKDFDVTKSVDIRLPKFKMEYDITLNQVLKAMGMELAFTEQADFSSINKNRDLFISFVKHKTFVEVDEEGTEAAAVTIIGFETTSVGPEQAEKIYFHCNRPFLFAITEKDTEAILFIGKVGNPALEE